MGAFFLKNENAVVWIPNLDNYLIQKKWWSSFTFYLFKKKFGYIRTFFYFKEKSNFKGLTNKIDMCSKI